jgi:MFS family permease
VISNLAVAFAPGFVPLVLARLVLGVAVGGFWGLSASLALRLVPAADLPMALSIIFGGGAVAGVAAASLGAFLGGQIGWRVSSSQPPGWLRWRWPRNSTPCRGCRRSRPRRCRGCGATRRHMKVTAAGPACGRANFFADALQPADAATILEQLPSRRR